MSADVVYFLILLPGTVVATAVALSRKHERRLVAYGAMQEDARAEMVLTAGWSWLVALVTLVAGFYVGGVVAFAFFGARRILIQRRPSLAIAYGALRPPR
ncbi:MAG: hypothetical protein ACRD2W_14320 [Acidimicrobiales bacterium]